MAGFDSPRGCQSSYNTMKKVIIGLSAILGAIVAQSALLGLNGLTILTIPMTLFLGFKAIDKALEKKPKSNNQTS